MGDVFRISEIAPKGPSAIEPRALRSGGAPGSGGTSFADVLQGAVSEVQRLQTEADTQIQKLVAGEDPKNPLTDQAIGEILQEGGVQIARRTGAKYRDQLGVLPARMRKRV